jgi:hypothetical protein
MNIKCFMLDPTGDKSPNGFTLYKRCDTQEISPFLNNAPDPIPVGAMWWCDWLDRHGYNHSSNIEERHEAMKHLPDSYFPDENGRVLAVKTPGGVWIIDSRASNCTKPTDNTHRCWIRHGVPPLITVDKSGGLTCDAGAGSIQAGSYHGFLRNGEFTS